LRRSDVARAVVIALGMAVLEGCIPELPLKEEPSASGAVTSGASSGGGTGGQTGAGGSTLVPYEPSPEVLAWLGENRGGWCNDVYNKFVNLCGDTAFCFDASLLKSFPNGLAVDVGFHWAGLDGGSLLSLGADDGEGGKLVLSLAPDGLLTAFGPGEAPALEFRISKRSHLVSYRVSTAGSALFVDGTRVATAAGTMSNPRLGHGPNGGPGAVLGQSASLWEKSVRKPNWLRMAPFFFHLRDDVGSTEAFDLAHATEKQSTSVLLLHGASVLDTEWKAETGPHDGHIMGGAKWVEDVDANCL